MKKNRMLACQLGLCLLLCSCAPQTRDEASAAPAPAALEPAEGQYVEHATDFPSFAHISAFSEVAQDTYYVLGWLDGEYQVWYSTDGGVDWNRTEYGGIDELDVLAGAFGKDGTLYLNYVESMSEDGEDAVIKAAVSTPEGWQELTGISILENYCTGMLAAGNGDLLFAFAGELIQIDLSEGREKHRYDCKTMMLPGTYTESDGTLAVLAGDTIELFDTATGESAGSIPCPNPVGSFSGIDFQPDHSGIFYCDNSGLYRVSMDGVVAEQLVDGGKSSFGTMSVTITALRANSDGTFLLLCTGDNGYEAKRFVFDENATQQTETQLHIYSLRESYYIRQVVALYRQKHPEISLAYHVGIDDNTAVSGADALRTFSAELLTGNGPDIIVLDRMPVDSYIQHGVLLDLSDAVATELELIHPTLAGMYQKPEGLFAVPTRFTGQLIVGLDIDGIHDLQDLADWAAAQEVSSLGIAREHILEQIYPFCAARWFPAENELDREAMAADLASLKQLYDMADPEDLGVAGFLYQAAFWGDGDIALMSGSMEWVEDIAYIYNGMELRGGGEFKLFPDVAGGFLSPSSILGVNAGSAHGDIAGDFVRFVMDMEAQQSKAPYGGLPANRQALRAIAASHEEGESLGIFGSTDNRTGISHSINTSWPSDDQVEALLAVFDDAQGTVFYNEAVYQIVVEETRPLFSGADPVDKVVEALGSKVERYFQEQG